MADTIDELYSRWSNNPKDAAVTIALCEALRGSGRVPLIQKVGDATAQDHGENVAVLVATGRMYMEAGNLQEAQSVLVNAGKLAPRDGGVYRWLGEVLLRRGDADRAEKVLERALHFGTDDEGARLWIDRARVFRPMQAKSGARAVAAEIAKTAGLKPSLPPPLAPFDDEPTTGVSGGSKNPRTVAQETPTAEGFKPGRREPSLNPAPFGPKNGPADSLTEEETRRFTSPTAAKPAGPPPLAPPMVSAPSPSPMLDRPRTPPARVAQAVTSGNPFKIGPLSGTGTIPFETPSTDSPRKGLPAEPQVPPYMPPPPMPALPASGPVAIDASVPAKMRTPDPRDVLDALELAGIFEREGGGAAATAWDRAERGPRRTKSTIVLVGLVAAFVGGGFGAYKYVSSVRAQEHAQAEQILAAVEADLTAGRASTLRGAEQQIGRAFELDTRSPRAALDWIHERATLGLLKGGADVAFEDAIGRAREVKIPEEKLAFALVASFLFQGDTAGAAALLPKWDAPAKDDAWYQLVVGATLERAGTMRAAERYAAANKLAPELIVAEMLLARTVAIDGDARQAAELAKAFRIRHPDRAEGAALVALAWGRDATRGSDEPKDVDEAITRAAELPVALAFVPHAMQALRAVDKHAFDAAKGHVEKGLAAADGPGVASWLGSIAIDTGDEQLARKSALSAVGFSAVYPPARVLAARVALLGDRLDEAMKATEELDGTLADVAVVRAAVAYEKVDADGLERAFGGLRDDAKKLPFVQPLATSADVLFGRVRMSSDKLVAMSDDEAPWSDLLAMDMALDAGDLSTAQKIAATWTGTEKRPLRALRLARLARYSARLDDADTLSDVALTQGTVTMRSLSERVFVLVARGKFGEVGPLLAKYPLVLGQTLTTWLNAYAIAASGKVDDARGKIAQLDPAPATSPLSARTICAMALGATKDRRRGGEYVKSIFGAGGIAGHPDLGAAAVALGGKRVERPGKGPIFTVP